MKKIAFVVVVIAFALGACIPFSLNPDPNPSPSVDVSGTNEAGMQTSVAQTFVAQPTFTPLPSETPLPTNTAVIAVEASPTIISSPAPAATDAGTFVPTSTFEIVTSTNVVAATVPSGAATVTPGIRTYGTLPPALPSADVMLVNKSKREAYISLQVVTEEGGPTIIEYPVQGQVNVKAPIGHYLYVAWVGGRKMVGEFSLHNNDDLTITLYADRVVIK